MKIACAFQSHEVHGAERQPLDPFLGNPEKAGSVRTQEPLVAAANRHRSAQIPDAQLYRPGALRKIEDQCGADFLAGTCHTRCIEAHPVIESHQARRNQPCVRPEALDVVVGRNESASWLNDANAQFPSLFVPQPSREMRGKFSAPHQHFIAGFPVDPRGNGRQSGARARGDRNLRGAGSDHDHPRNFFADAVRKIEVGAIR